MLLWRSVLINKGGDLAMMIRESGPRMNVSSTEQSQGSTVWSTIQGNILGGFVDKDKHPRSTGQRKAI